MNVYDSELVAKLLLDMGYSETENVADADAIFLNTCSIREKAEETVYNRLNNLHYLKRKKPSMIIGVLEPNPTVSTVEIGVSSIPFASFPNVFAVAGYTIIKSDLL